ncbi:nuclear transcription factor Y subunit beta-like [Neodiprion fabricii]|uniref:nuclear transcription factor Y subunit beta-like n=1 Tax=Neodiprion fabricii TaxID=2872261 RepID=UPI001ED8D839|nr:nuclear transcription factor Y subunit beta-like [Neodiprion fabricii]
MMDSRSQKGCDPAAILRSPAHEHIISRDKRLTSLNSSNSQQQQTTKQTSKQEKMEEELKQLREKVDTMKDLQKMVNALYAQQQQNPKISEEIQELRKQNELQRIELEKIKQSRSSQQSSNESSLISRLVENLQQLRVDLKPLEFSEEEGVNPREFLEDGNQSYKSDANKIQNNAANPNVQSIQSHGDDNQYLPVGHSTFSRQTYHQPLTANWQNNPPNNYPHYNPNMVFPNTQYPPPVIIDAHRNSLGNNNINRTNANPSRQHLN